MLYDSGRLLGTNLLRIDDGGHLVPHLRSKFPVQPVRLPSVECGLM